MYSHTDDIEFDEFIKSLKDNISMRQKIGIISVALLLLSSSFLLFPINEWGLSVFFWFGIITMLFLFNIIYNKYRPLPSGRNFLAYNLYSFSEELSKLLKEKSLSESEKKKITRNSWSALSNLRFKLKEQYGPSTHFMTEEDLIILHLQKILTDTKSFISLKTLNQTPPYLIEAIQRWSELFYQDMLSSELTHSIKTIYSMLEKDRLINHSATSSTATVIWQRIRNSSKPMWFIVVLPTLFIFAASCYYHLKYGLTLEKTGIIVGIWVGIEIGLTAIFNSFIQSKK